MQGSGQGVLGKTTKKQAFGTMEALIDTGFAPLYERIGKTRRGCNSRSS